MFEIGYLIYDDKKTFMGLNHKITELYEKLGYSKELVSRLISTITQLVNASLVESCTHGIYFFIQQEFKKNMICCRMDALSYELNITEMETFFDSMEQVKMSDASYCIFLKHEITNFHSDMNYIMELRTLLSSANEYQLGEELSITQQTLKEQQILLEESNQARLDFFSNISHEIRTPMNAIMGMTYLLDRTDLDAVQRDYLEKMKVANRKLLNIVNEVLDLSKLKTNEAELIQISFDKEFLYETIKSILEDKCDNEKIQLKIEMDKTIPPYLIGDPYHILELLEHYMDNAVKFTEVGTICVSIHLITKNTTKCNILFEVKDTGKGLTDEEKSRLFQSFQQIGATITKQYEGIGVGLTLVKELARYMKGDVGVESKEDEGSNFWFRVSLDIAKKKKNDSIKILLVEDNALNQLIVVSLLKEKGIVSSVAQNGKEALDMLQKENFDLIFMDIQMPVMDGITATKKIRNELMLGLIPIIAMTANTVKEDKQKCLEIGMNDFLTKPLEPKEFFIALLKWLPISDEKEQMLRLIYKDNKRYQLGADEGKLYADAQKNQKSQESSLDLNDNPILDLKVSLRRMMGNETLYRSLADKFFKEQENFSKEIRKKIEKEECEEVIRDAHTLKGLSGTIGGVKLQKNAEKLEKLCQQNMKDKAVENCIHDIDINIVELRKELIKNGFLSETNTVLQKKRQKERQKEQHEHTKEEFISYLAELKSPLELQKPKKCNEILQKIEDIAWMEQEQTKLDEISICIHKYKYKEALSLVNNV